MRPSNDTFLMPDWLKRGDYTVLLYVRVLPDLKMVALPFFSQSRYGDLWVNPFVKK